VRSRHAGVAIILALAALAGACGGPGGGDAAREPGPGTAAAPSGESTELGVGVDDDSITIGVSLVDFECIQDFVDEIRLDQQDVYQAFIDDVNERGGVLGRRLEARFFTHCPIPGAEPSSLTTCTAATEDDQVFALVGQFVDFTGDAQLCVTRDQERVLITHMLTQAWIDQAPPALLLTPDITAERRLKVILTLLRREGMLDGRTVAVLAESNSEPRIGDTVEPELAEMDVTRGTDGVLTITGADTSAAQAQLDAFVERWKSEGLDALIVLGQTTAAKQFVEKVKAELPELLIVIDNVSWIEQAQDYVVSGATVNPYEGVLAAEGETGEEHMRGDEGQRCQRIYEERTGNDAPGPNDVVPGPNGKRLGLYGSIADACAEITMFVDIASAVGPNLNNENWRATVDGMGPLRIASTKYASLGPGKYDADDTYRLVAFDSSVGEEGDWRAVTEVMNVADL